MAKRLTDETLRMDIVLNGNEAQKQLGDLQQAQRNLKKENAEIQKQKAKLVAQGKKETEAYKNLAKQLTENNKAIKANREEQNTLRKEMGLSALTTRQLAQEEKRLKAIMGSFSPDTPQWHKYNKELQEVVARKREVYAQMRNTTNAMGAQKKSLLDNAAGWLGMATGIGAAIEIGRRAITWAKDFIAEGIELVDQSRGIEFAFKALGDTGEDAFNRVKQAARGTLSDLDIKRSLVELANFDIPLDDADALFEFLIVRATQTGESVDKLRDSLVEGLSKESLLRIDNLGISTAALNEELKKTPNFVQAVANIAKREVAEAGDILDEAASGSARWNAALDNLQLNLGKLFGSATSGNSVISFLANQIDRISIGVTTLNSGIKVLWVGLKNVTQPFRDLIADIPVVNSLFSKLADIFSTPGIQVFGTTLQIIGASLSGIGAAVRSLMNDFVPFVKSLSAISEIKIDPFDLSGSKASVTAALKTVSSEFEKVGANASEAFNKGFRGAMRAGGETVVDVPDNTNNDSPTLSDEEKARIEAAKQAEKQRQEAIKRLEEKYITEKENRLANSNEKRAKLEMERALAEANALKANKEVLQLIEDEHKIKIDEARARDEEVELQGILDFENRKRELENQIALENAASEEEREILKQQQENEKAQLQLEQELERLQLNEAQKTELLKLLTEQQNAAIAEIENKWREKKIKDEEAVVKKRKALFQESVDAAIQAAGAETKVGQALLIVKQLFALKEQAIALGLFTAKANLNAAEAATDIAKGTAKTASSVPFPANIPLIIGFAATVAGLVKTIKSATKKGQQAGRVRGYEDGLYPLTRTDGKTFNVKYGGRTRTGIVSKPTHFSDDYMAGERGPELVVDNATFRRLDPTVVRHILNVRSGVRGYEMGKYPQQATVSQLPVTEQQQAMQLNIEKNNALLAMLMERFSQPIQAVAAIGYRDQQKLEEMEADRKRSAQNGTLAE
ncbi:hypothetical protein [Leeuwenhoekiella sp. CH_XMU1409-2]|uniref:hypothetical protein n=1 Tax=Leeuwenhoekiella sp. CH_XMU1409-2 TaxID=3107768 RepID=UPI00300AA24E